MSAICELLSPPLNSPFLTLRYSCGLTAIANLVSEILMNLSPILMYWVSQKKQSFECRACKNKTACSQLYIPYAAKLLFQVSTLCCRLVICSLLTCPQELQSMNIAARLYTVSSGRVRDTQP